MALIYFSRSRPPHPRAAASLVSGVVNAGSVEEAKAKLAVLLQSGLTIADDFAFTDLATVPPQDHGVLVITMQQD